MMASFFQMNTASSGLGSLPGNTIANPKGELKAITTRSGLVLDGPSIPMPPPFINPKEDERAEKTLTDPKLAEYTIKVPPLLVQKAKPPSLRNYVVYQRDPRYPHIPYPSRMNQEKQQEKYEIQIHKFWQMFKQLYINITLSDALILIMKYQKLLKALLSNKEKLLELANTPPLNENCSAVILKKLPEKLGDPGKFLIPYGFSKLKCKALSDQESINMIDIYNDSYEDYLEDLFATNLLSGNPTFSSHTDLTSPKVINPLSGNTTSSSPDHLLEEFADKLALITFPLGNDDLLFDIESDLKEIGYLLNHDPTKEMDSILEDSVDECNLADPNNNLVDTIPEMFTDEHTLDYSSPSLYDDVDDDLVELESSDFLPSPEYDSVLYEDFSKVNALPSTNNEDKDFNPPLYELPFHKEVPGSETLLSFSSKNKENVFNPRILTSKGVHISLLLKLSHRGPKAFKVIKIFKSPMEIFPCSYGEDTRILDVSCLHFYPP
uniref:Reverse transcriptase domain-containing protein n=1 Tax=Tanacetum cinerariifolium TaxID=118510 RepID=A0A699HJZ6_TANCI|nr:reverse transcriptase domain-containing protein [Tanacetum cinerariifolium]